MQDLRPSGFVDLQVNGFAGINFSDASLTLEQVQEVCIRLAERGTLAFCPTVITSGMPTYRRVLPVLAEAIQQSKDWPGRLFGIHLEGPFISSEEGAVGVHPREFVRQPSNDTFDELFDLSGGNIALITMAPELPGALALIRHAVERGVVVSVGHTLADARMISAAIEAGARLSTHLGNGCPNLLHRHNNPIWPQLAAPELTAMLITDGHHLPPEVITSMLAAKGPGRVIVTSDAAPAAGCLPGEYAFFGTHVLLEPSGRLRNLERDTLAGSSASMLDCMNVLAGLHRISGDDLWRVGRDNALAILGKSLADLPAGKITLTEDHFVG